MASGSEQAAVAAFPFPEAHDADGSFCYTLSLEKQSDTDALGLTLAADNLGAFIIQAFKAEGMVPSYNKIKENSPDNPAETQVIVGDWIVSENGMNSDLNAMKEQLMQKQVTLTIRRKTPKPAAPADEGTGMPRLLGGSAQLPEGKDPVSTDIGKAPEHSPLADSAAVPCGDVGSGIAPILTAEATVAPAPAVRVVHEGFLPIDAELEEFHWFVNLVAGGVPVFV